MSISPQMDVLRVWFFNWWPQRGKARAVATEWAEIFEQYPHAVADLARFCNAGDTSLEPSPTGIDVHRTVANEGRREVWLHLKAIVRASDRDEEFILGRTEE